MDSSLVFQWLQGKRFIFIYTFFRVLFGNVSENFFSTFLIFIYQHEMCIVDVITSYNFFLLIKSIWVGNQKTNIIYVNHLCSNQPRYFGGVLFARLSDYLIKSGHLSILKGRKLFNTVSQV